jgi:predicted kinase
VTVPDHLYVLVAGWPGSGKSTLAAALAPRLGLPLLAKDEIKEALMDALGQPETVTGSQQLGRAAVLTLLRVAARCPGAVLDSTWFDYALPLARALPGRLAEVHCTVPRDVARARFQNRHRHPGHRDTERTDHELWPQLPPSPGLGLVIEVDTTTDVDLDQLVTQLSRP